MTYCRETRDKKNAVRERVNFKPYITLGDGNSARPTLAYGSLLTIRRGFL
jgi:hypothetical protein